MDALLVASLAVGLTVLLLPWRAWSTRERLEAAEGSGADLSEVTVLIPARDEAALIGGTLRALAAQGEGLSVVLVDDQSGDGTAAVAAASPLPRLTVVRGAPLPEGWSGKLWALHQGLGYVKTPLTLLLDADIELAPGLLVALCRKRAQEGLCLVSVLPTPSMTTFWERLLLPAFVYFFKLLYPFSLANRRGNRVAAAAGGCLLVETEWLARVGGFPALKDALIDDCTLAARLKAAGGRTWVGLTHAARSRRRYDLAAVWDMVARTAYTQLRYSAALLAACTAWLTVYYLLPPLGLLATEADTRLLAGAAYLAGALPYLPTLRYCGRSPAWALLLPFTAALYLAMTWTSALRYARGERSRWKGRRYAT